VASHTQDDGFHEIQLNGKQLVFLFMAATVVSVVIFLCGVLVGRGVRVERGTVADVAALNESPSADPEQESRSATIAPGGSDPTTAAAPQPAADALTYPERLSRATPQAEDLKPAPMNPAPAKPAAPLAEKPKSTAATKDSLPTAVAAPAAPRPGPGYAVQVAALNVRGEADAIARRLSAKGYAAYVQTPSNGTPSVYRVRIGTFKTKREAETMAARLQKEEQFNPWVTR
jgi:cell division septation protein DedD